MLQDKPTAELHKSPAKDFVHLHLHSDYSLLESAIQLKPLARRLTELEMKSCDQLSLGNPFRFRPEIRQ